MLYTINALQYLMSLHNRNVLESLTTECIFLFAVARKSTNLPREPTRPACLLVGIGEAFTRREKSGDHSQSLVVQLGFHVARRLTTTTQSQNLAAELAALAADEPSCGATLIPSFFSEFS